MLPVSAHCSRRNTSLIRCERFSRAWFHTARKQSRGSAEAALPATAHCSRRKISLIRRERFSRAWFYTARVSESYSEAAQKRRVYRAGAARAHCAFTRASAQARRCVQRTEHNGGFGFQTKVKDRFLNQRR